MFNFAHTHTQSILLFLLQNSGFSMVIILRDGEDIRAFLLCMVLTSPKVEFHNTLLSLLFQPSQR